MSAEATVVRTYIDTVIGLPWRKKSTVNYSVPHAEAVLDNDHYGLEKVKERIVEYLAVQQRVDKLKAPILCLVGPPGVGKTSLGQSLAKATNRQFIRMALGGVRDEAEIRGHRRTYIGSMPGKILQNMSKVGVRNPLFYWMKSISLAWIFVVILPQHYLRCWTQNKTTHSKTITLKSTLIFRM